jgi:hypothetical protein
MTNKEEILMIKCPACNADWIRDDNDLVCKKCAPGIYADTIVSELHNAIQELDHLAPEQLKSRLPIIRRAKLHLDAVLNAIQGEKE